MRILFEEHHYPISELQKHLDAGYYMNVGADKAKTTFVGYYYSQKLNDSVFILPKVFVKEKKALGHYPEEIMCLGAGNETEGDEKIEDKDKSLLFSLSVWIYQAIKRFAENNEKTDIKYEEYVQNVISSGNASSATYLDIVLQLIRFHRENGQLLAFTTMMSKKHNDRICWTKTINRRLPFLQDGAPIYMDTICKTKELDLDEELIVLFYSVLEYLQQKFCFRLTYELNYNLYPASKIENLIEGGGGKAMLKRIRHKYFKDVFVQLWNILYAFFDKANQVESSTSKPDVLITKKFNIIFEAMVDQLVSDSEAAHLKNLKDGKIIDHIFEYKSIIPESEEDRVYYILDSKYYKDDNNMGDNSIYKQFTYAKNVIQYCEGKVNNRKIYISEIRLRDDITEGYDITPNFFIRGYVNEEYNFDNLQLEQRKNDNGDSIVYSMSQFEDRLFDRDTLMALEYDANFLYILVSYVQNHQDSSIKEKFRKEFQMVLNNKYRLYYIDFKDSNELERFVEQNFKYLNGKIIRYPKNEEDASRLILAIEPCDKGCGRVFHRMTYNQENGKWEKQS